MRKRSPAAEERERERQRAYYALNKQHILERKREIQGRTPWVPLLSSIRQRCTNPRSVSWKYYGGKGIRCLLSIHDVQFLWLRDGAKSMRRPSIDRMDADRDYVLDNCRFVELEDNARHAGEDNGRAKLTVELVRQIRARYNEPRTYLEVALEFGVGESQVGSIIRGESWDE